MLEQKKILKFAHHYIVHEAYKAAESMAHLPYDALKKRAKELLDMCSQADWLEKEIDKIEANEENA